MTPLSRYKLPSTKQAKMSENELDKDIINPEGFKKVDNNPIQRIKVIGVGGGGNNAVIHMFKKGIKDVSFVLLNTDRQVLDNSEVPHKVLIGPGRGAGGVPEKARKFAEENADRIAELFDDRTDMVFITAGMGGGTGTGAGPVVARIAKERGILTVGIVTVPFKFEGKQQMDKALKGAEEMAKNVDSLLVIKNERLAKIYKDVSILNAFAKADDTLLNAAQSITDIITNHGIINRDFNDVDSTLREGGPAIISTGYGEGPDRVTKAIHNALNSPLLSNTDILSSKRLLFILYIPDDDKKYPFNMDETDALDEFVTNIDNGNIKVMWGLYKQRGLEGKVRITILASGFDTFEEKEPTRGAVRKTPEPVAGSDEGRAPEMPSIMSKGKLIDPAQYDNPEGEEIREFERVPAIDRNPYRSYMTGFEYELKRGGKKFAESHSEKVKVNLTENGGQEKNVNVPESKKDGKLLIDFNDL